MYRHLTALISQRSRISCGTATVLSSVQPSPRHVLRLAQLGIIQFRFVISALQATLMVRLYAALLTFGQFVLSHCASLESAFIARGDQKGYDTRYFILNNRC